jgi:NADPH-dependent glutamate synthase beta subunit-like oxidoreductase
LDKNFLRLIYLSLLRRPYFQVYGGVRFGGTISVEKAWSLGFDHIAIAVGAGLPQILAIPNPYQDIDGKLEAISNIAHCKEKQFGPFTSQHRVTFVGDTHPAFHGSVVKAVASDKRTYPHIMKSLQQHKNIPEYANFKT